MKSRPPLRLRVRYWFDNTMARGAPALIGWLAVISLAFVIPVSALLVWAEPGTPTTLHNQLLEIWKNVSATFNLGGAIGTPAYVLFSVLLALVALFFASTLVGLITAGVNGKIMNLRKGRSVVLEKNHTILLGWSDQVFPIYAQLVAANANQPRSTVAVLAQKDKTEMEDELRARVPHRGSTKLVCRTGNPADPEDISLAHPNTARSVIIVAPSGDEGDIRIIQTLLALMKKARPDAPTGYVVASVRGLRNRAAARLAGGPGAKVLGIDDITSRLIAQTCRQPGLSVVYMELFTFEGDEIYTAAAPGLVGKTYGEALLAYETSSVIGLRKADGTIAVNPPSDTPIGRGDKVIAISEDDDTVVMSDSPYRLDTSAIVVPTPRPPRPERFVMLSWNRRGPVILRQLDAYVTAESSLLVVAPDPELEQEVMAAADGLANLRISFQEGNTNLPGTLSDLKMGSYDHVIALGADAEDDGLADSRTLVTLLHLRELERELGRGLPLVAEMSDDRTQALAPVSGFDDFIVSDKLISLLMTQISENHDLAELFDILFDAEGCEIYLKPAGDFVALDHELDFYTVVESARRQGQSAIGYRVQAESTLGPHYGVHLNPDKRKRLRLTADDSVIVVAED